ncbi:hypothetical protein BDQ17DRAFT_1339502 [Cyathus striatus]|nr:hypothetical protein BDQ17DRAFT_1339502 [Cyathus striatus]
MPKSPEKKRKPLETKEGQENLTLNDWLTVVAYFNRNQPISQDAVVKHFAGLSEPLIFSQPALSRHLSDKEHASDLKRMDSNPTALSGKRVHVITCPDVEKALVLWVYHMQEKGEHVTSAMLVAKRSKFEDLFDVPNEERYKLKEYRRHGESGSGDLETVEKEREHVRKITAKYAPQDIFNFDETGLFGFAPPDCGLATKQMSGKKSNKT